MRKLNQPQFYINSIGAIYKFERTCECSMAGQMIYRGLDAKGKFHLIPAFGSCSIRKEHLQHLVVSGQMDQLIVSEDEGDELIELKLMEILNNN